MFKHKKNKELGITLIALVVTIIVLLILAGVSISMLAGDNSILRKATDAKQLTEAAALKEQAEIIRNAMLIDKTTNRQELTRSELVAGIAADKYFTGSRTSGNKVVTKDQRYDINVDSNLNITVTPHVDGEDTGTLVLTATQRATESRAAVIKVAQVIANATPESELQPMFVAAMNEATNPPFELTWDWFVQRYGEEDTMNKAFEGFNLSSQGYSGVYDLIIKTGANNGVELVYPEPATFTLNGEPITGTSAEFVVTKNGSYTISAVQGEESGTTTIEVDKCKTETFKYPTEEDGTMDVKGNCTITQDGYTAVIPAGFAYGTSENVGTIATGLVITDEAENGYSTGNEFVWIPVKGSDLTVGKNIEGQTNTGKEMATNIGTTANPKYRGILYNWSSDPTGNTPYEYSSNGYREPDEVSYDTGDYASQGINKTVMQNEYDAMIASVKQYGGFYVGRYEMGDGATNISRIGVTPISAAENEANMWYGLYKKAKAYNKTGVTSGMIWGSQYDAMLNFALTNSSYSGKVNASTNGNHSGKLLKTGTWLGSSNETDKINNIFDLEGNFWEWTKEAYYTNSRVGRGGDYNYSNSPSSRIGSSPVDTFDDNSSRPSLYINL